MVKTLFLITIFLSGAMVGGQEKPATQSPLSLGCKLPSQKFNNLERIPVEVRLKSPDVDIDRAVVNPEATPAPGVPYLEIVVEETPRKGKPAGPIKLSRSGQGRDLGESYVRFDMEIPIDATERREKISKHLDDLVREVKTKKADPKLLKLYEDQKSREGVMATFERIYFQNKIGAFELGCHFFPNHMNSLVTPVQSSREKFVIEFKSDFLDQPTFH